MYPQNNLSKIESFLLFIPELLTDSQAYPIKSRIQARQRDEAFWTDRRKGAETDQKQVLMAYSIYIFFPNFWMNLNFLLIEFLLYIKIILSFYS